MSLLVITEIYVHIDEALCLAALLFNVRSRAIWTTLHVTVFKQENVLTLEALVTHLILWRTLRRYFVRRVCRTASASLLRTKTRA